MIQDVGPNQFRNLIHAVDYYSDKGFSYMDVPWAVMPEALSITTPPRLHLEDCPHYNGGYIVASAEQSFLHLQYKYDKMHVESSRYVTLTPYFRNEIEYNQLHRPWFMKVELVDWNVSSNGRSFIIETARAFFQKFLDVDVIKNQDLDPIGIGEAYDIVSHRNHIELGSYGIRKFRKMEWIYGTGCAEPRLSYAIEMEKM